MLLRNRYYHKLLKEIQDAHISIAKEPNFRKAFIYMIDQDLLAKIPKKYQPLIVGLRRGEGSSYWIKLKEGYEFKGWRTEGDFYEVSSFVILLKMLHEGLNDNTPIASGNTKEGSRSKDKDYKTVTIKMTEEDIIAFKRFLAEFRKQNNQV